MRRRKKMPVPAALTPEDRATWATPAGRMMSQQLARGCSPRVAASAGQAFALEVTRLCNERDVALAKLARILAALDPPAQADTEEGT